MSRPTLTTLPLDALEHIFWWLPLRRIGYVLSGCKAMLVHIPQLERLKRAKISLHWRDNELTSMMNVNEVFYQHLPFAVIREYVGYNEKRMRAGKFNPEASVNWHKRLTHCTLDELAHLVYSSANEERKKWIISFGFAYLSLDRVRPLIAVIVDRYVSYTLIPAMKKSISEADLHVFYGREVNIAPLTYVGEYKGRRWYRDIGEQLCSFPITKTGYTGCWILSGSKSKTLGFVADTQLRTQISAGERHNWLKSEWFKALQFKGSRVMRVHKVDSPSLWEGLSIDETATLTILLGGTQSKTVSVSVAPTNKKKWVLWIVIPTLIIVLIVVFILCIMR